MDLVLSVEDFKALSSDSRVKIIKLLGERNHTLSEIAKKLGMSAPSAKQHLDILSKNRLVALEDSGHKWKYYSLSPKSKKLLLQETQGVFLLLSSAITGIVGLFALLSSFPAAGLQYMGTPGTNAVRESAPTVIMDSSAAKAAGTAVEEAFPLIVQGPNIALLALGLAFIAACVLLLFLFLKARTGSRIV